VLQNANTRDMIFDVATLVAVCSERDDAAAGRHHHQRHAVGRRLRAQAADLDEGRRCLRSGDRRHRACLQNRVVDERR
jgi:hypothetical protein